jgi:hypothetical protein
VLYMKPLIIVSFIAVLCACNRIEAGSSLSRADIERIRSLHLLDSNERVCKFYSEYKNNVAGNFFTNKRLAKYWLDERDSSKNEISSAFYSDIRAIDTTYYAGLTYCPYLLITKSDGTSFKVCVDGKREEIQLFFEEALDLWARRNDK